MRAREADSLAAFGGIVALNRPLDADAAEAIVSTFIEAVIAPAVDEAARAILAKKANMRVVVADFAALRSSGLELRSVLGAMLAQERDFVAEASQPWSAGSVPDGIKVVTKRQPTAEEWEALRFAWRVCAHVKSNTVIFTDARRTLAIGAGQMSRVDAVNVAVMKAARRRRAPDKPLAGSVAASDAFFPFRDGLDAVAGGRCDGCRSARRIRPRRGSDRRGRRARARDGVHRAAALQALTYPTCPASIADSSSNGVIVAGPNLPTTTPAA